MVMRTLDKCHEYLSSYTDEHHIFMAQLFHVSFPRPEGTPEHASRKSEPDASHLTQTADLITVCLPKAVAPEVVPVVLEFLYTDQLETDPENGPDGHGRTYVAPPLQISPGRCLGKSWRSGEDPGDLNWRFKNHGDFLEQARFERGEDNIYPKQKEWNSGTAESKGEVSKYCDLIEVLHFL